MIVEIENVSYTPDQEGFFDIEREHYLNHEDFEVSKIYNNASQPIMYFIATASYKSVLVTLFK